MSLLQNEDFLIWQLRTSYLTHIKDGIGERLINVDSSILNDPSFRAAGWTANAADIKRTYSPPIPTAISSDYFAIPPRSSGVTPAGFIDEEDEGGMVTGRGSADTVGPGPNAKRRRRREPHDEDDSSDLSDESDDDIENTRRAAQQIKFAKMPVRSRSGSSPIRDSNPKDGVDILITSPSRRSTEGRLRSGSLTGVEAVKQRARRDTTTSSDMSSENELDPSILKRRQINAGKVAKANKLLPQKSEDEDALQSRNLTTTINEDSEGESDRTDLSSEFGETVDSESLLDDIVVPSLGKMPPPLNFGHAGSPKKISKSTAPTTLQALPPPRPISTIIPASLLGQALRARKTKPTNPVERFARLSGKGGLDPLYLRIYAPFSENPDKPIDMPLLRNVQDNNSGEKPQVIVADAIGLALFQYREEGFRPAIDESKLNVNRWSLRMIEEGEVDFDFPALSRTRPIVDFTSRNNRGARGRSKEKPYDEFALVETTDAEFEENRMLTPQYDQTTTSSIKEEPDATPQPQPSHKDSQLPLAPRQTPIEPADKPLFQTIQSTPRMGAPKLLKIHFTSLEAFSQISTIEVTTDTYLAEVLDQACKRWKLDKAYHILKVSGTNTIAPVDRTVEALGPRTDLDLTRRRFANEGPLGLAGSPGSSSPNAPLFLTAETPRKGGQKHAVHPLAQKQDLLSSTARYKKYNVIRKQPMSFAPSHQRVLLMDEDYMHILPGETGKTLFDSSGKTSRVPFRMIVGCKVSRRHPKTFRVVILRDKDEQKRYDFEAQSVTDAAEIVEEIRKGMEPYGGQHLGLM